MTQNTEVMAARTVSGLKSLHPWVLHTHVCLDSKLGTALAAMT